MKKKSTSQPVRPSPGESEFFNLRVLIGLVIVLAGVLLALVGFGAFSNASAQPNLDPNSQRVGQMTVIPAVHSDLSPPLREQPVQWPRAREERETPVNPSIPFKYKGGPDPVIQSSFFQPLTPSPAIPAP